LIATQLQGQVTSKSTAPAPKTKVDQSGNPTSASNLTSEVSGDARIGQATIKKADAQELQHLKRELDSLYAQLDKDKKSQAALKSHGMDDPQLDQRIAQEQKAIDIVNKQIQAIEGSELSTPNLASGTSARVP